MEAWCRGVGPSVVYRPQASSRPVSLSELTVVTWNVQAGGGDIDAFVADLRSGRLGGGATDSFILLLQEAFRGGRDVPEHPGRGVKGGRRVAPGTGERGRSSIEEVARRNGLHLLYVPSMRNGGPEDRPEDRGNAILSTLPLGGFEAFELPLEKQRRVAVSAVVLLLSAEEEETEVRFVNLHLDPRSAWGAFHRSLGAGRAEQAEAIAGLYGGDPLVVLGGDLNTWFGGRGEEAVRILSEPFPQPESRGDSRTVHGPGPLPDLLLDHLFFRLPAEMSATYTVIDDRYGSDHHPVVGRIHETLPGGPGTPRSPEREPSP